MKITLKHRVYTHDDGTQTDVYDPEVDDNDVRMLVHGFKLDYEVWRPLIVTGKQIGRAHV